MNGIEPRFALKLESELGPTISEGLSGMEDKAKTDNHRYTLLREELQKKAKDDPELARKLATAEHVIERYSEALLRLADS